MLYYYSIYIRVYLVIWSIALFNSFMFFVFLEKIMIRMIMNILCVFSVRIIVFISVGRLPRSGTFLPLVMLYGPCYPLLLAGITGMQMNE